MKLVDTHAHLTDPRLLQQIEGVVGRANDAGVTTILTLAAAFEDCEAVLKLADRFPSVYAAVGVHPNEVDRAPVDVTEALTEFARHPKVVAIGEAGMDYHYLPSRQQQRNAGAASNPQPRPDVAQLDQANKERQRRVFIQQLELAVRLDKPIVIHERDCFEDLMELLKPYRGKVRGVFHCFGRPIDFARQVLEFGFMISLTGMLTFKRNHELRQMVAQLPLDRLMLETDCPYMAPEPHRGKSCEPAMLVHTAAELAKTRGESVETVVQQTSANAARFFNLP